MIGDRLREIREEKNLSQGEVEKRTGLLRCYISRVENGHTVPAIQTLERMAQAFDIPLYQLFYDGDEPPQLPSFGNTLDSVAWGHARKEVVLLRKLQVCLGKMNERDRKVLLAFAHRVARRNKKTKI